MTYDTLGRINAIKAPAPTTGATRVNHTFDYISNLKKASALPAIGSTPVAGTTMAVSWGGTRLDLFARGTGSDLIHRWSDDGTTCVQLGVTRRMYARKTDGCCLESRSYRHIRSGL